ncbi:MCE family protein [Sesbania bispinosa]|nr:MCE family protein [Sesbania bispinosa]
MKGNIFSCIKSYQSSSNNPLFYSRHPTGVHHRYKVKQTTNGELRMAEDWRRTTVARRESEHKEEGFRIFRQKQIIEMELLLVKTSFIQNFTSGLKPQDLKCHTF